MRLRLALGGAGGKASRGGAQASVERKWILGSGFFLVYNMPSRPSDGMADVAVSKTVVERRASSNLASGTIDFIKTLRRLFSYRPVNFH